MQNNKYLMTKGRKYAQKMLKKSLSQYLYCLFSYIIDKRYQIISRMQAILSLISIEQGFQYQLFYTSDSVFQTMAENSLPKYAYSTDQQNPNIEYREGSHFATSFQQKRAMLHSLKNQLQKYDNVDQIPADEIDYLCESVHNQIKSNLILSPSEDEDMTSAIQEFNSVGQVAVDRQGCNNNLYLMKFKQILLISMFVLCIIIKNIMIESNSFDVGQYTVYNTRYNRSMFEIVDSSFQGKFTFQTLINKILPFASSQNQIQLYLPKQSQVFSKKKQIQFAYGDCVNYYPQGCIANRLSLYGSISLQLQQWLLDSIKGNEKMLFQANLEYTLCMILAIKKIKKYEGSMSNDRNKVILLQDNTLTSIQLNSIKLSLIEDNCQDNVVMVKSISLSDLKQFDYIFITQQLFARILMSPAYFLQQTSKPPLFIIHMPQGLKFATKHLIQPISRSYLKKIQFNREQSQRHYIIDSYRSEINNPNDQNFIDKSITCLLIKKTDTTHLEQDHQHYQIGQRINNHLESKRRVKQFKLRSHECINSQKYNILQVPENFKQCVYLSTLLNFKLLVPNSRSKIYQQQGAVWPELLFFIVANINSQDTVLFQKQFYEDDLILATLAKQIQDSNRLYCVFPSEIDPQIFLQNIKINSLQNVISYTEIKMDDAAKINNLYDSKKFNVIFTSVHYFNRDYFKILKEYINKTVVFNWTMNPDYVQFLKNIINRHTTWTIIDKQPRQNSGDSCNDFDLIRVNEDNIIQFNGKWMIVQI